MKLVIQSFLSIMDINFSSLYFILPIKGCHYVYDFREENIKNSTSRKQKYRLLIEPPTNQSSFNIIYSLKEICDTWVKDA